MSAINGDKIVMKFSDDIIGDVTGNLSKFHITLPSYTKGSNTISTNQQPISLDRYGVSINKTVSIGGGAHTNTQYSSASSGVILKKITTTVSASIQHIEGTKIEIDPGVSRGGYIGGKLKLLWEQIYDPSTDKSKIKILSIGFAVRGNNGYTGAYGGSVYYPGNETYNGNTYGGKIKINDTAIATFSGGDLYGVRVGDSPTSYYNVGTKASNYATAYAPESSYLSHGSNGKLYVTIQVDRLTFSNGSDAFAFDYQGTFELSRGIQTTTTTAYAPEGNVVYTISEIQDIHKHGGSTISWSSTTSTATNVKIYTKVNSNSYKLCTNGSPIPDLVVGTDYTNATLSVKAVLTTSDVANLTPILKGISIKLSTPDGSDTLMLTFPENMTYSLEEATGTATIQYSNGTLRGNGGLVENFTFPFSLG